MFPISGRVATHESIPVASPNIASGAGVTVAPRSAAVLVVSLAIIMMVI